MQGCGTLAVLCLITVALPFPLCLFTAIDNVLPLSRCPLERRGGVKLTAARACVKALSRHKRALPYGLPLIYSTLACDAAPSARLFFVASLAPATGRSSILATAACSCI
jgi:hypothetical protein